MLSHYLTGEYAQWNSFVVSTAEHSVIAHKDFGWRISHINTDDMCRMLVNEGSPHQEMSWTPIHKVQVVGAAIVGDVYPQPVPNRSHFQHDFFANVWLPDL